MSLTEKERNQRANLIFGSSPQALVSGKIPTVKQVLLGIEFKIIQQNNNGKLYLDFVFDQIVDDLIQIYLSLNEKTFNLNRYVIKRKVKRIYDSFFLECKRYSIDKRTGQFRISNKKTSKQYKDSMKFKNQCSKLFEISTSKPTLSQSIPTADSSNADVTEMQTNSSDIESGTDAANNIERSSVQKAHFSDSSNIDVSEMHSNSSDIESETEDANNLADPDFVVKDKIKRIKIRDVV